ncbi:hypothetical protein [Sulfurimonas sp.]|uniref:hypothetical protein n=1 Tax=Sulfurimonas sp. TaxID=2022749 RepID=UPI003D14EFE0
MFTKFKKTNSIVFLDPHSQTRPRVAEGAKIDIILSPSLYWVKKLSLPVKYIRDARKLLPSIFEDILPDGNYNYAVFKEGEEFIAFAYEDKKILDELNKKNISASSVENVYFAQTELQGSTPCKINDNEALVVDNGIIFLAPIEWLEEVKFLSLTSIQRSNKTIKLQQFSHIIDKSSLNKVGILLGVFIVVLMIEMFITSQKISAVEEEQEKLLSEYKLYSTMMQNKAVLSEYETTYQKQTKLRNILEDILKLQIRQKITKIELKNKVLHITLQEIDEVTKKQILQGLVAYKANLKSTLKDHLLEIEVTL